MSGETTKNTVLAGIGAAALLSGTAALVASDYTSANTAAEIRAELGITGTENPCNSGAEPSCLKTTFSGSSDVKKKVLTILEGTERAYPGSKPVWVSYKDNQTFTPKDAKYEVSIKLPNSCDSKH